MGAQVRAQDAREVAQDDVADVVAARVVDVLEAIDVADDDAELVVVDRLLSPQFLESARQGQPVERAGQRVDQRLLSVVALGVGQGPTMIAVRTAASGTPSKRRSE
jgi:hypothetical protein